MSIYYITASVDGFVETYAFNSTSEVTKRQTGSATSFPIETGAMVADHYINNNTTVSFSGVITDVPTSTFVGVGTTRTIVEGLEKIKRSAIPFNVHMGNNLEVITNCLFESLDISQSGAQGSVSSSINAYRITFNAKQVKFGKQVRGVYVAETILAGEVKDEGAEKKVKSGYKESNGEEKESSIGDAMKKGAILGLQSVLKGE